MKLLNEIKDKDTQQNNSTDVLIGITDDKEDARKFKFKRPMMLKIFIPLCIIILSTLLICILSLTSNNYVITFDDTNKFQGVLKKNVFSSNKIRDKRQLEDCEDCDGETNDLDLEESILRCKKNIENNMDCCELYKKIKELNKHMKNIQDEFNLLDIPCKHLLENEDEEKKNSSSSSSSSESKNEEDKSKEKDENAAEEIEDNNKFSEDKKYFEDYDNTNKNIEKAEGTTKIYKNEEDWNYNINFKIKGDDSTNQEDNQYIYSQQEISSQVSEHELIYTTEKIQDFIEATTTGFYQSYTEQINTNSIDIVNENVIPTTIPNKYNNYDAANAEYEEILNVYDDAHKNIDENYQDFTAPNIEIVTVVNKIDKITDNYNVYNTNIAPQYSEQNQKNQNYDRNEFKNVDNEEQNVDNAFQPINQEYYLAKNDEKYEENDKSIHTYDKNYYEGNQQQNYDRYQNANLQENFVDHIPTPYDNQEYFQEKSENNFKKQVKKQYHNPQEISFEANQNQDYDLNAKIKIENNTQPPIVQPNIHQNYYKTNSETSSQNNYYPLNNNNNNDYNNEQFNTKYNVISSTPESIHQKKIYGTYYRVTSETAIYNYDSIESDINYEPESQQNSNKHVNEYYTRSFEEKIQNENDFKTETIQHSKTSTTTDTPYIEEYFDGNFESASTITEAPVTKYNQVTEPTTQNNQYLSHYHKQSFENDERTYEGNYDEINYKDTEKQGQNYDVNININVHKSEERTVSTTLESVNPINYEANQHMNNNYNEEMNGNNREENNKMYGTNKEQHYTADKYDTTPSSAIQSVTQQQYSEDNPEAYNNNDNIGKFNYAENENNKEMFANNKEENNKMYGTNEEQHYTANYDKTTPASALQSVTQQHIYKDNSEAYNSDNIEKFNFAENENKEQIYDVKVKVNVENYEDKSSSTTLKSVNNNHNYEENNNYYEEIYDSKKEQNINTYDINQEQLYTANFYQTTPSSVLQSVTQQQIYEDDSEAYKNSDNIEKFNYAENDSKEQMYDVNINVNVENYEDKTSSTTLESVNINHNYEEYTDANHHIDNYEEIYDSKKEQIINTYGIDQEQHYTANYYQTTPSSVLQYVTQQQNDGDNLEAYKNNDNIGKFNYAENVNKEQMYDVNINVNVENYEDKTSSITLESVTNNHNYEEENSDANHHIDNNYYEEIYDSKKDQNINTYGINQEQDYTANYYQTTPSSVLQSVTQQQIYEDDSEALKNSDNIKKINYAENENKEQMYDVNINVNVENYEDKTISTTLESVHNTHNYEEITEENNYGEDIYDSNKQQNINMYGVNEEQHYAANYYETTTSSVLQSVTQQQYYEDNSDAYKNNNDNVGKFDYSENENKEQIYDVNINVNVENHEDKTSTTTLESVNQQHQYEDHSETNLYPNNDGKDSYHANDEENTKLYPVEDNYEKINSYENKNQEYIYDIHTKVDYSADKIVSTTSEFDQQQKFYEDKYEENTDNIYLNEHINEKNTYNKEQQIVTVSTTVESIDSHHYYEDHFEEKYRPTTTEKVNYESETPFAEKEFLEQLIEMNANILTYPDQITETPFVQNILTQPSNLYQEKPQTKMYDNPNYDNLNYEDNSNKNNFNEENIKDLTTKQTESNYYENDYNNNNTDFHVEPEENREHLFVAETITIKHEYLPIVYEEKKNDYVNNYNNDVDFQVDRYDENHGNVFETDENHKQSAIEEQAVLSTNKVTSPIYEKNDYFTNYNNNQEEKYDININVKIEENNEKSTTEYEEITRVSSTQPSLNHYEKDLMVSSYHKNEHELKPEQMFKESNVVFEHNDNVVKYDEAIEDDNSIDYYTDNEGNVEEYDPKQQYTQKIVDSQTISTITEEIKQHSYQKSLDKVYESEDQYYAKDNHYYLYPDTRSSTLSSTTVIEETYAPQQATSNKYTTDTNLKSSNVEHLNDFNSKVNSNEWNKNNEEQIYNNYYASNQRQVSEPIMNKNEEYSEHHLEIALGKNFKTTKSEENNNEEILDIKSKENKSDIDEEQNLKLSNTGFESNAEEFFPQKTLENEQITEDRIKQILSQNKPLENKSDIDEEPNLKLSNTGFKNNTKGFFPQKALKNDQTAEDIIKQILSQNKPLENKSDLNKEQNLKFSNVGLESNVEGIFPQMTLENEKIAENRNKQILSQNKPLANKSDEEPNLKLSNTGLESDAERFFPQKTLQNEQIADDRIKQIFSQDKPPELIQEEIFVTTEKIEPRLSDNVGNDIRIVNQNPIAQRFQNTGAGNSKFDNIFQLPPIETSKASQQLTVNTNMMPMCFYGVPNQNGPVLRQPGYESQINPFSMPHTAYGAFGYPQMYPNSLGQQYNYYNSMMSQQKYSPTNLINQNNPYFCTYVPSSSLQFPPVSGIQEFRNIENKNFRLPDDIDDKSIPKDWFPELMNSNKSRSSIMHCLPGEKGCFNANQCIKSHHWCDGVIHCTDKSDELGCPCKTRVEKSRLCDGYFDCPNGEDELGCFGCSETEFSCDDWTERHKTATCVPLHQRCDGVPQCKTGKDEMDCSLLTNTINVHQTYAVSKSSGFLHRNFKGSWFPVCSNTNSWILEACLAEVGPQATFPLVHLLPAPNDYTGQFLTALPDRKTEFLKTCMGGEAVYVICPPIPCGTRLLPPPNHYRKHEVDTSNEEDFLPFVNRLRRFTDEFHKFNYHPSILSSNDIIDKKHHVTLDMHMNHHIDLYVDNELSWEEQERKKRGETRVVGGKPSQPTSWPWVVAIYRDGIFHCGGVLMSELWVITAAHCVDMFWQHYYEIQAGMLRRFSYSPMEQNRIVSNIIGHQMYDRTNMKNDLALLKVATPFQFNRWVRPVCLPSETSAGPNWMWGPIPGTVCTAVGWGATIEHGPDPDHMREVEVPILAHCKHREDQEGQEICAGYLEGGRDACQGDSGGPLLCRNPVALSQWYVAGIVSHGEGCARPNEPGAYTRVSLYLNWIARSILDENLPKRRPIQKCPGTLCLGTHRCISKKRRCDKTIDCLVGDDEIDCPKNDFPSLIKHAFDNMLLFAANNITTEQSDDKHPILRVNEEEINKIENDDITRSAFKDDSGQTTPMNRNGDITTPVGEISDITKHITNAGTTETPSTSITPSTFITDDTISKSTTAELATITTASVKTLIINDSRGALNRNDKNIVDHKTETSTEIKSISETSTASNVDDFTEIYMNASKHESHRMSSYFECRKMLQLIPMSRRCDNVIDCEDGTDEARCSCKGYLFASHPNAICDGVIDCADGSDEKNCINCPETHFHCHLSQQCIPKSLQCNHVADCFFNEDEWDCFALTNGSYIRYDNDERPELHEKGVMSFSFSGKWFPLCNNNWIDSAHDVAGDMCAYLGFSGYHKYVEIEIKQDSLKILSKNATTLKILPSTNETCRGLYLKCSNSLSDTGDMKKIYTAHQSGANTFKEVLMSPWNAAIFVDGVYTCSGTLIEKNWVITSRTCLHHTHLHINYTTVMLGTGGGHLNVVGPHEQIRLVSEMDPIIVTDILLLKLQTPVTFTRYVRPLYIRNINNDIGNDRETCIVLGKENDSFIQAVVLKPVVEKCMRGKRCFKRVTPLPNCEGVTSTWGGTIVCLSETGWYPAAVYYDLKGTCGFRTTTEYTSIRNLKARIINALNKRDFPVTPPSCNGIRCALGQCVSPSHLCDGISDCRDGSDETQEICDQKHNQCRGTNNCDCAPNELKCHNGHCVSKSAFCDRINDCGDWSDEPARCNCSAYLSLVAPHRLCDGVANCHDKSDENPRICECRENSFKCGKSEVCIPYDWVCDGDFDCPDKEDELFCLALRAPQGERDGVGEVVLRSYGVWHPYCIRNQITIPDLQEICRDLGHNTAHAAVVNKTFNRPPQDIKIENFSLVRFNQYVMLFLKGDHPLVRLEDSDKCERLYIACTPP